MKKKAETVERESTMWTRLNAFKRLWEEWYTEKYYETPVDRKTAFDLGGVPVAEVERRTKVYLADPFWGEKCRHSFGAFGRNFNRFVPIADTTKTTMKTCMMCRHKWNPKISGSNLCPICFG